MSAGLVNAKEWPSWYSNSSDVQITDPDQDRLGLKSKFTWRTFGFPVSRRINEFVPNTRLGWFGDGIGIRAYHAWLILLSSAGSTVVHSAGRRCPGSRLCNSYEFQTSGPDKRLRMKSAHRQSDAIIFECPLFHFRRKIQLARDLAPRDSADSHAPAALFIEGAR